MGVRVRGGPPAPAALRGGGGIFLRGHSWSEGDWSPGEEREGEFHALFAPVWARVGSGLSRHPPNSRSHRARRWGARATTRNIQH
jgi:hypothetical protein